ncbi:CPBP family intramembrane glutamic endopeptidase [Natronosalvus vescus]|uniref:CPBP family intramembrane glutamic endopeptidase n=1 Tax=Natronosalvus vescus TaxID=2953881 RepID=UPI002091AD9F|nr:CPBP family intramembrane glutamic endopeptidase [Natronosalvus vescus]
MTQWATFAVVTGVVLTVLLVLSYLTQQAFEEPSQQLVESQEWSPRDAEWEASDAERSAPHRSDPTESDDGEADSDVETVERGSTLEREGDSPSPEEPRSPPLSSGGTSPSNTGASDDVAPGHLETDTRSTASSSPDVRTPAQPAAGSRSSPHRRNDPRHLSTGMLLANVAFSQGLLAAVILGAAVYAAIPPEALGVRFDQEYLVTGLLVGTGIGIALYVANELGAGLSVRLGIDHDESLRELLAPEDARGWFLLLVFVLPIIAFFEELLFRAALIGALSAGFDVPIWLLAVGSSLAFAVGHGMQGTVGIIVTGALGLVLAALFIVTQSLLVVVVAHYLINALEFVVHEGLGLEWAQSPGEPITES